MQTTERILSFILEMCKICPLPEEAYKFRVFKRRVLRITGTQRELTA
jgi:hypothetical protein